MHPATRVCRGPPGLPSALYLQALHPSSVEGGRPARLAGLLADTAVPVNKHGEAKPQTIWFNLGVVDHRLLPSMLSH